MRRSDIIHLILTILFMGLSLNLFRTTISMFKNRNRLIEVRNEVTGLESKIKDISDRIAYKQTDAFVEDFARNELNMVKPNEDIFVVYVEDSSGRHNNINDIQVLGMNNLEDTKNIDENSVAITEKTKDTPIRQWLKLFF